jgi:hypothetical protein
VLIKAVNKDKPKMLLGLDQKRYVVRYRGCRLPCRGWCATGRKARPYPGVIEEMNEVTPSSPREGRLTEKKADETAGKG